MASVAGNWFVPIVGISDSALHWFSSCLSEGRPLLEEAISPFTHGVPQGVILVVIFCLHASFSRYHSFFLAFLIISMLMTFRFMWRLSHMMSWIGSEL